MHQSTSDLPNISITGTPFPVAEDGGQNEVFTIRLSQPAPAGGLVVNVNAFDSDGIGGDEEVSTVNISNIALNDQNAPVSFTIAEGATEAQVVLTPVVDNLLEDIEINYLTLLPGSGYVVDPTSSTAATILLDANDPNTVSIFGNPIPVAEDSGQNEVFTIRLSKPAPVGGLVLNVNAFDSDGIGGDEEVSTVNISNIALNDQNAPVSFTIAEGATEAQIVLTPIPDNLLEGTEINYITLLPGSGYRVNPFNGVAITALADSTCSTSDLPSISITGTPFPVAEDGGQNEVFTIRLSQPAPVGGLVVNVNAFDSDGIGGDEEVSTINISNIALNDQNAPVSFTIAEGATEAQVILTPVVDNLLEDFEVNYLTLLPGSGYVVDPTSSTAATILLDANDPVTVSVFGNPIPVTEDSGQNEVFTIRLSKPAPVGGLVVNVNAFDSDGVGGDEDVSTINISDITINNQNAPVSFTIAEGATEAQIVLTPILDNLLEGTEINYITILPGSGYRVNPFSSTAITALSDPIQEPNPCGNVNGSSTWYRSTEHDALIPSSRGANLTALTTDIHTPAQFRSGSLFG